jgi:alginate O-acetyltransferase complex protein AlgI
MLFNSRAFLICFLPLALAIYAIASRRENWRLPVLLGLSIAFYSYWDWNLAPLLVLSILINWIAARIYGRTRNRHVVTAAIIANLAVLGTFKYLDFLIANASAMLGEQPGALVFATTLALPLGISFFTFHHIMYLTDLRDGKAPLYDPVRYGLYIGFFPQVLSGPLVRWHEFMHQLDSNPFAPGWERRAVTGALLIVLGLLQKVFLGDRLATVVEPAFAAAAVHPVAAGLAWQGILAFTFQIFFDFSGYSDIAIGLGLLFGVRLPENFAAPYRATSLRAFWRRWHMTLSRFLRDYLYVRFGGNRHGLDRQVAAVLVTMALGGLWHGAAWTFVAWGLLHGFGLAAGVLWRARELPMPPLVGWMLTFVFVMLTWVFFRAATFEAAWRMFDGLFLQTEWGPEFRWHTIALAAVIAFGAPPTAAIVERLGMNRWVAAAAGVALAVLLMEIGGDQTAEFIYFKF